MTEREDPGSWAGRLPAEVAPPPDVRRRVVGALQRDGLIQGRASRSRVWLQAAAAVALFAAGWAAATARHSQAAGVTEPRFMFLLYGETSSPEDAPARAAEYGAWARDLRERGARVTGERLEDLAMTLGDAPPVDAPVLGGFFIVEAQSAEAARALAAAHPHVRHGGTIVVRGVAGS